MFRFIPALYCKILCAICAKRSSLKRRSAEATGPTEAQKRLDPAACVLTQSQGHNHSRTLHAHTGPFRCRRAVAAVACRILKNLNFHAPGPRRAAPAQPPAAASVAGHPRPPPSSTPHPSLPTTARQEAAGRPGLRAGTPHFQPARGGTSPSSPPPLPYPLSVLPTSSLKP